MRTVTIEQVMEWYPCSRYTREVIEDLFAGREILTAEDVAGLSIPVVDKIWALLHDDFLSKKQLRLLACDFAERVLPIFEQKYPDDKRPRNAIDVARRYASGEATISELITAAAAADAAAANSEREWQLKKIMETIGESA